MGALSGRPSGHDIAVPVSCHDPGAVPDTGAQCDDDGRIIAESYRNTVAARPQLELAKDSDPIKQDSLLRYKKIYRKGKLYCGSRHLISTIYYFVNH